MKRIFILALLSIVTSVAAITYAGTPVSQAELPKTVKTFLGKYFPGDEIRKAEKEQGRRGAEYEVDLGSGTEIEFRDNGDWKDIKAAPGNSVPSTLVPSAISKYVTDNYRGQKIVEISRKRGGYEIELSNGSELKLTEDAKPMPARQGGRRSSR